MYRNAQRTPHTYSAPVPSNVSPPHLRFHFENKDRKANSALKLESVLPPIKLCINLSYWFSKESIRRASRWRCKPHSLNEEVSIVNMHPIQEDELLKKDFELFSSKWTLVKSEYIPYHTNKYC